MSTIFSCSEFLISRSINFDYYPGFGQVGAIFDLYQKFIVIPGLAGEEIEHGDHYYTILEEKSALRCLTLLVPVIGNFIVYIYDLCSGGVIDRDVEISHLRLHRDLSRAHRSLRSDEEAVLFVIERNAAAFMQADATLRDQRNFVLKAAQKNGLVLEHVGTFRDDREIALAAIAQNENAIQFLGNSLKNDQTFFQDADR